MEHSEILLTIAEVGVALAGFASLISVLGRSENLLDFTRLLGLVRTSLSAAGFALLPFVPHAFGLLEPAALRLSAAIFVVVQGSNTFFLWRTLFRMRDRLKPAPAGYYTFPAGVLVLLLGLAAVALPAGTLTAGFYIASLGALLSVSGVLFLSLFGAFIRSRIG